MSSLVVFIFFLSAHTGSKNGITRRRRKITPVYNLSTGLLRVGRLFCSSHAEDYQHGPGKKKKERKKRGT